MPGITRQPERFMVTDSAMFIQINRKDSLFLHADTISAITVVRYNARRLQAYESILRLQDIQQGPSGQMRFPLLLFSGFSDQACTSNSGTMVRGESAYIRFDGHLHKEQAGRQDGALQFSICGKPG